MTNTQPWWPTLVETALLGTDRRQPDVSLIPAELRPADAGLSAEKTLLRIAALAGNYLRAGAEPLSVALPDLPVCPPETKSYAPKEAMRLLTEILDEQTPNRRLLGLWFRKCRERAWVVPPNSLPTLLNLLAKPLYADCYNDLPDAVGERGRWLSQFNKEWDYVKPADLEMVWRDGDNAGRLVAFRKLRQTAPANALALLQTVWPTESAKDRVKWMGILAENAISADESFAQEVLNQLDAVKKPTNAHRELRTQTVALLLDISGSALFGKTQTALAQYVIEKREMLINKVKLFVLPTQPDAFFNEKTMTDYGLETDAAHNEAKQIKQWFFQLLALIHPSCWTTLFGVDYNQLVDSLKRQPWFVDAGIMNFTKAIIRDQKTIIAGDLIPYVSDYQRAVLLSMLPHAISENRLMGAKEFAKNVDFYGYLTNEGAENWSLDFSQWVVQELGQLIQRQYELRPVQRQFMHDLVLVIHPATAMTATMNEADARDANHLAYAQNMMQNSLLDPLKYALKLRQQIDQL